MRRYRFASTGALPVLAASLSTVTRLVSPAGDRTSPVQTYPSPFWSAVVSTAAGCIAPAPAGQLPATPNTAAAAARSVVAARARAQPAAIGTRTMVAVRMRLRMGAPEIEESRDAWCRSLAAPSIQEIDNRRPIGSRPMSRESEVAADVATTTHDAGVPFTCQPRIHAGAANAHLPLPGDRADVEVGRSLTLQCAMRRR